MSGGQFDWVLLQQIDYFRSPYTGCYIILYIFFHLFLPCGGRLLHTFLFLSIVLVANLPLFLQLFSQHYIASCTPSHVRLIPVFFCFISLVCFVISNVDALLHDIFGLQATGKTSFTAFCVASFNRHILSSNFSDLASNVSPPFFKNSWTVNY